MSGYDRFDTLRDAAREHTSRGNESEADSNLAAALTVARAGFAEDPAAWIPRLGLVQRDIERAASSRQLLAESEAATQAILTYAREGANEDQDRRRLLLTRLNAFSMQLEAEQRTDESLALAVELLSFLEVQDQDPTRTSQLAHTRSRTAELRLATGDPAGALELADTLVDMERRRGSSPTDGAGALPSWLQLRGRALLALGRATDARTDFESSLEWLRARVHTGRFFLADLDLADALDEYAELLSAMGAGGDARAASEAAHRIRGQRGTG